MKKLLSIIPIFFLLLTQLQIGTIYAKQILWKKEEAKITNFEYTPTIDYWYLGWIYTETSWKLRSIWYDYIYNENNYWRVILSNQEFTNLHSSILLAQCDDECNIYIRPFIVWENWETKYYNSSWSINWFHLTKYDWWNDFYLNNQILSRLDFGNVIPTSIQNSWLRTSNIGIWILWWLTIVWWVSVLLACSWDTITIECGLSIIPIEAIQATRYYGKTVKEIKKWVLWFNTKTKASSYLSHFGRSLWDTFLGVWRKLRNKFVNRFSSLSRDDLLLVERLNKKLTGDYINGLGDLVKKINDTSSFDSAKKLFIKGRLDKMNVNSRGEFVEAERVLQKNIDDTDKFIRSFDDGRYPRLLGGSSDGKSYEVLRSELGLLKHKEEWVIKKLIWTEVNPVDFIIQNWKIKFGVSHSSQDMANAKNVDYAWEIYTDSNWRITSINNNSGLVPVIVITFFIFSLKFLDIQKNISPIF